jgi:hypothetical protein
MQSNIQERTQFLQICIPIKMVRVDVHKHITVNTTLLYGLL